jgi:hypothetical protein
MPEPTSAEKRQRATSLANQRPPSPTEGNLDILWDSPFDQMCYCLAAPALARKQPARYGELRNELMAQTGCTEDELLTHGLKVRSVLFFAEDRLGRQGALASLVGAQQLQYRLPPVSQSF